VIKSRIRQSGKNETESSVYVSKTLGNVTTTELRSKTFPSS